MDAPPYGCTPIQYVQNSQLFSWCNDHLFVRQLSYSHVSEQCPTGTTLGLLEALSYWEFHHWTLKIANIVASNHFFLNCSHQLPYPTIPLMFAGSSVIETVYQTSITLINDIPMLICLKYDGFTWVVGG